MARRSWPGQDKGLSLAEYYTWGEYVERVGTRAVDALSKQGLLPADIPGIDTRDLLAMRGIGPVTLRCIRTVFPHVPKPPARRGLLHHVFVAR